MPIDPRVALGVQQLQLQDPLAQYGKVAAIQSAQNQNALAQYQLGAAQRTEEQANALGRAYSSAFNPQTGDIDQAALLKSLAGSGVGAGAIPGALKAANEAKAAGVKLQAEQATLLDSKLKQSRDLLSTIDPYSPNAAQQYLAWHQANHRDPVIGQMLAARGVNAEDSLATIQNAINKGPEALAALINRSALGVEKFMEMNKPHFMEQNTGTIKQVLSIPGLGGAATIVPGSAAQTTMSPAEAAANKVALGNLAVSQGNLRLAQQNANKGQVVETENGPVLVDQRTGQVKVLTSPTGEPLAGKGGAFTEGQTNAATFALRMRDASKVIDSLSSNDLKLASAAPGLLTGALPESAQKAKQAKLDFITAVLRKESGAVIGPDEIKSNEQIYFPAVGDSDAVILQKAQARRNALAGMESAAGKALQAAQKMRDKGQPQPTVDIDKLLNKYK